MIVFVVMNVLGTLKTSICWFELYILASSMIKKSSRGY